MVPCPVSGGMIVVYGGFWLWWFETEFLVGRGENERENGREKRVCRGREIARTGWSYDADD